MSSNQGGTSIQPEALMIAMRNILRDRGGATPTPTMSVDTMSVEK